jgi:hypothetical protein
MLNVSFLDLIPLWAIFAITATIVLVLIEVGYRFGLSRGKVASDEGSAPIASVIGSTLGLLAFLLAFTFGMAATRFETRRQLLLDEVNAIGTCYLRSHILPAPQRMEIQKRMREYVHLRAKIQGNLEALPEILNRCEILLDELWAQAAIVAKQHGDNEMYPLFVISLNEVIDFHTKRVVVSGYRIPSVIWFSLYLVSMLSMAAVGYQFGRVAKRDLSISVILALAFSIVIYLIADLDRTAHGNLTVDQRPMIELDEKLDTPPP